MSNIENEEKKAPLIIRILAVIGAVLAVAALILAFGYPGVHVIIMGGISLLLGIISILYLAQESGIAKRIISALTSILDVIFSGKKNTAIIGIICGALALFCGIGFQVKGYTLQLPEKPETSASEEATEGETDGEAESEATTEATTEAETEATTEVTTEASELF